MAATQPLEQAQGPQKTIPITSRDSPVTASVPPDSSNLVRIESRPATANDSAVSTSTRLWSATSPNPVGTPLAAPVQGVGRGAKGVVLHVTEESVRCEILHGRDATRVWLPRKVFPNEAAPGYTFELTLETQNGYRVPCVTPRQPEQDPALARRLAEIQAEFG